jgi:predicted Zn-dependent protease
MSGVGEGILVESFQKADLVTGRISSMIDYGTEIQGGAPGRAVVGAMIGTDLLEVLRSVRAVSSDVVTMSGSVWPWLVVEGIHVSG